MMLLTKLYLHWKVTTFFFCIILPALSFAKGEPSDWEGLFEDSFKSIFSDSIVLNKEILSGCEAGHKRGRFLWIRVEDLPEMDESKTTLEISRLPVLVRYGEFYFEENGGKPYLTFHALNFSGYFRTLRYFEICAKNNAKKETYCASNEIKFAIYDRDPKVTCSRAGVVAEDKTSEDK